MFVSVFCVCNVCVYIFITTTSDKEAQEEKEVLLLLWFTINYWMPSSILLTQLPWKHTTDIFLLYYMFMYTVAIYIVY